ncbi:MAG: hypothetical protein JSR33_10665 [Proteobacteria bacterium]|nr:hypothetical protein [Pseudomonadota bacterium]
MQDISFDDFLKAYFDSEFAAFDQKPSAYYELIALLDREPHPNLEVLLKGLDICDKTDLRNEFSSLQCAVDLIEGQQDNNVPVQAFEKIKTLNSSANIHTVPNAQHMPFWTDQNFLGLVYRTQNVTGLAVLPNRIFVS